MAVKVYEKNHFNHFVKEVQILRKLEKYEIFPKIIKQATYELGDYFDETLIGIDLYKLFKFENKFFNPITILNISIDILTCLSYLNEERIVYCDLKGDNFIWNCFDINNNESKIILIDFSCSV